MTQLDVMYSYGAPPAEAAAMALARVREVYGVRALHVDEAARTVRIEYDASRLTEPVIHQLLRRTGLDVTGRVSLLPPQPIAEPTVPAAS